MGTQTDAREGGSSAQGTSRRGGLRNDEKLRIVPSVTDFGFCDFVILLTDFVL
jgi:hypothetical protein